MAEAGEIGGDGGGKAHGGSEGRVTQAEDMRMQHLARDGRQVGRWPSSVQGVTEYGMSD